MTVRIHSAEKMKDYTDLLLALLAGASIPALENELRKERDAEPDAHPE